MRKIVILLATILVSHPAVCGNETRINLKEGVNSIDLNNDGVPDNVFMAIYDNNTSHPSQTLTVFVNQGKHWFILPVPDDDGFTWADFRLSASALKISGFELHRYKSHVYLVRALKYAGETGSEDISDVSRVKFLRYRLAENHTDPGTSVYDWNAAGSFVTEKKYNDVDEAFQSLSMEAFR